MSRSRITIGSLCVLAVLLAGCASQGGVNREKAATANAGVGADYLRKGDNERARRAFTKALSYDARNFTANWGMAVVSQRLEEPDKARRYFKKTLSIQSTAAIYNSYAVFLCGQGETKQGMDYFQRALDSRGPVDHAVVLANAGLCQYRAERPDDAADYFHRALHADAKQVTALTYLAKIAYHAHNFLHARAFIERADAASNLDADQLLLAARTELARHDRSAAASYLQRYNAKRPAAPRSLHQLESSRP